MVLGHRRVGFRPAAFGILVVGAAVVAALGLSLLAGERYAAQVEDQAALTLLTPATASAFLACPPTTRPERETRTTITTHGGVTTFSTRGRVQALSNQQVLRKAECLRRRGLITTRTLTALRSQASAPLGDDLVRWWAPIAIVPNRATVFVWSLLLIAELIGAAAMVSALRRRRRSAVPPAAD